MKGQYLYWGNKRGKKVKTIGGIRKIIRRAKHIKFIREAKERADKLFNSLKERKLFDE